MLQVWRRQVIVLIKPDICVSCLYSYLCHCAYIHVHRHVFNYLKVQFKKDMLKLKFTQKYNEPMWEISATTNCLLYILLEEWSTSGYKDFQNFKVTRIPDNFLLYLQNQNVTLHQVRSCLGPATPAGMKKKALFPRLWLEDNKIKIYHITLTQHWVIDWFWLNV